LNGSKILHDHCTFENVDGVVTVVPKDGAAIMVNGLRIESPQRLRSGYRVILGDFHIFRFNHPQEAREERAEQGSLLKYSVTADQLDSPTPQNGHGRSASTFSRALSEIDGESSPAPGSPMPFRYQGRDNDWSFARREAVTALLGPDQKISSLTDDELDVLFEDLQRVRAVRKARPEGRLFDSSNGGDDDTSSVSSQQLPLREKYLSNGTLDNFSLDTALTAPSTPHNVEEDEQFKQTRADMQEQLDKQKEEFENQLATAEDGNTEIADIRVEKAKMEEELRQAKEEMQKQLAEQKAEFTKQLADIRAPRRRTLRSDGKPVFTERDIYLAKHVLDHWRRHRYIAMAASALRNASTLKEAQVLSQQMERSVVFQFAVVDLGSCSQWCLR
jgi:kinesin family protein 1